MPNPLFKTTESNFLKAVYSVFEKIEASFPKPMKGIIKAYIAGGVAVHLYTNLRVSNDIDAIFSHRVILPNDLIISYTDEQGQAQSVYFDYNYNDAFALMHPDYRDHAFPLDRPKTAHLRLFILSPLDLVISKLSRYATQDIEDIQTLCQTDFFSAEELKDRAFEALDYYIGDTTFIKHNIKDTIEFKQHNEQRKQT